MALEDCLRGKNRSVFIIGPSLKQTRKIITPLLRKISTDAPKGLVTEIRSDLEWRVGDSQLYLGGFETALESIRGMEAFSIYLEESGLTDPLEYDYIIKSVLKPTMMHTRGRMYHLTTPPKEENHPFIFSTVPSAEAKGALFTFTIEDNPLLTPEVVAEEIQEAGGRGSEHCERELFCKVVKDVSRLLTPEFSEGDHVKTLQIPEHRVFLTAVDFGGSVDPHCALLLYFDFKEAKVCVADERWIPTNTSTEEIMGIVKAMEKDNGVLWRGGVPRRIVDAPPQILIDLHRWDFTCQAPKKERDLVKNGVQAIRMALLNKEILISPRCKRLIQTCKYGMWNHSRKEFQRSDALGHCDALAALIYGFRHLDRATNPYPVNAGMHRDTHFFVEESRLTIENAFEAAFYGDDD